MKKVIFLNSHPIQYFAPLYQYMVKEGLPIEVWYCSDESIRGKLDKGFGTTVKWDIPLLEGYNYRFYKNWSWKPSIHAGFFGLINLRIIIALFKEPSSLLIAHGWGYFSHLLFIVFARLAGHTICLRAESPLNQELLKSTKALFIKKLLLRHILFRFIDHFLYVGQQNKAFYEYYRVSPHKLLFAPYSVDNERFQASAIKLIPNRIELRKQLGIPENARVLLYSGKYIPKKRPLDLIRAFHNIQLPDKALVMVGEGELRVEMESYIKKNNLSDCVWLTGFINQQSISHYYAIADMFIMCSEQGETWGLVVNEAMNFGLPVVVSDLTGCCADLVTKDTGRVFKTGNIDQLSNSIMSILEGLSENRLAYQNACRIKVDQYSYSVITDTLKSLFKRNIR